MSWTQPRGERAPPTALRETTRVAALVSLLLMVPALYVDAPTYVELVSRSSDVLPYMPVAASGLLSVLVGAMLYMVGAFAAEYSVPMDAIARRRFYVQLAGVVAFGLLLLGAIFPRTTWEMMMLLVYSMPGIIGVYAVALPSARLAWLLFLLAATATLVDREQVSGWVGPTTLAVTLLVFVECMDAHGRFTRAMRTEMTSQRALAGGGASAETVRGNHVIIQDRFLVVLGWTVALSTTLGLLTMSSVGIAAWAGGGALPHSLEVGSMTGLAVPIMMLLLAALAFHVHRTGLRDEYTGKLAAVAYEVGPAGPLEDGWGEGAGDQGEAWREGHRARRALSRALTAPRVLARRVRVRREGPRPPMRVRLARAMGRRRQ
jgi:hypothetical protein